MSRIPDEDVQRVREATDIVAVVSETVQLRKKGRLLWGNCPFHNEKTPSFKVDPASQLWHCFGCGAGGDTFGFVMRSENLEFPDAVRMLADRARIEIHEVGGPGVPRGKRERLLAACDAAAAYYHRVLVSSKQPGPVHAREYLAARGFGSDVARRWTLGYAPGGESLTGALREEGFSDEELLEANLSTPDERSGRLRVRDRFYERIMFPIHDVQKRTVGFGGRILGEGQPKYLNTSETPVFHKSRNLYGIDRAKNEIVTAREAVVVEGYTDVIALHEAGIANVVATLGTALTAEHTKMLGRFTQRVVYLFDGDEAGVRAALRAADLVDWSALSAPGGGHVEMAVALIPEGSDPADWVSAQGADPMRQVIEAAEPLLGFVIERRLAAHDVGAPEGRSAALADVAGALAAVKGSLLEHDYVNVVADRLLIDDATVRRAVMGVRPDIGLAAGRSTEGEGTPEVLPVRPVLPETAAEREVARLLAMSPGLRPEAAALLDEGLVASPALASVIRLTAQAGELIEDGLVADVRSHDPVAADLLSGIIVMDAPVPEKIDSTFRGVVSKLKETALERRIHALRAEMKTFDPTVDKTALDRLHQEAAGLQRELGALRDGMRADSQDSET